MRMQDATVLEIDELMLATPPDPDDAGADHGSPLGRRHPAAERGVMQLDRRDASTDQEWAKRVDGSRDFR
jgi:hypothetical protein